MRKLGKILTVLVSAVTTLSAYAGNDGLFLPERDFSFGAQVATAGISSSNSEFLLLLNPVEADARATLIAPFVEYAYRDNRTIGARVQFLSGDLAIGRLTLDLLNEGLSFDVSDVDTHMSSIGASLFHRNYFGLDAKGRVGLLTEFAFTYSSGRTDFDRSRPMTDYSSSSKLGLSFSPGFIFFVMNNVSLSCSLSMLGVNYNTARCFSDGSLSGSRRKFGTRLGPDVAGINFGISLHL